MNKTPITATVCIVYEYDTTVDLNKVNDVRYIERKRQEIIDTVAIRFSIDQWDNSMALTKCDALPQLVGKLHKDQQVVSFTKKNETLFVKRRNWKL